jgi:HD-GYP domain-containing protein (c-di-GMP phosphodiesterase class II)
MKTVIKAKSYDIGRDKHYKNLIAELIKDEVIITTKQIRNVEETLSIDTGTQLTQDNLSLFSDEILVTPLDQSLKVRREYLIEELISDLVEICNTSQTISKVLAKHEIALNFESLLDTVNLPNHIKFNLRLCKTTQPSLYHHSLVIAVLSSFIAAAEGLSADKKVDIVIAALLHDIGLLHLDINIFNSDKKLTDEEHRYLHVHAVLSQLIAEVHKPYSREVAAYISDHHERLDGSGYPKGKKDNEISVGGQILAIAEVMASQFNEKVECKRPGQLELLMNMNFRKLNPKLYSHIKPFYSNPDKNPAGIENIDVQDVCSSLEKLANIIDSWKKYTTDHDTHEHTFIHAYINTFDESLIQAGVNFINFEFFTHLISEDEDMRYQSIAILNESSWQVESLVREIKRRKLLNALSSDEDLAQWFDTLTDFSHEWSQHRTE